MIFTILLSIIEFYGRIGDLVFGFYIDYSRLILDYFHLFFDGLFYITLMITILFTVSYLAMGLVLMMRRRRYKEVPVSDDRLPFVTVQIPTYNEMAALNCARRCLAFDYPKDKFEIIIGDDSSDASVSQKIDAFAREHGVKVTRRGSNIGFKPGNLNHMLKHTKGEYIVIFDSDFLPEKDFLRRIISPFVHDSQVAAVQARWVTNNFSQNLISVIGGTIPLLTHHLGLPFLNLINGNTFIAGSAEAIRKKDLLELGGWQSGSLTEDIEYSLRMTQKGKRILYLEDLHCKCEAPFTLRDLGRQQMRWAYGVITAIKKHFGPIIQNSRLQASDKINIFLLLSGYVVTFLFFILGTFGLLSIITHRPDAINWSKFISQTTLNILLTSGFFATTIITLMLGRKFKEIPRMMIGSFTVGVVIIYIVTLGIFKAIFNRPMHWYMLNKNGNNI